MTNQLCLFDFPETDQLEQHEFREVLHSHETEETLLARLFGRNGHQTARKLFNAFPDMQLIANAEPFELASVIGSDAAEKLLAALNFSKRVGVKNTPVTIREPNDVHEFMRPYAYRNKEYFWVLTLNVRLQIMGVHEIYKGSVDGISGFRVAEILRPGIVMNATSIILVHNHPSGDPSPSPQDIIATRAVCQSAIGLDIKVRDHIIITPTRFYSIHGSHRDIPWGNN